MSSGLAKGRKSRLKRGYPVRGEATPRKNVPATKSPGLLATPALKFKGVTEGTTALEKRKKEREKGLAIPGESRKRKRKG